MKLFRSLSMRQQVTCIIAACLCVVLIITVFCGISIVSSSRIYRENEIEVMNSSLHEEIEGRIDSVRSFSNYTAKLELFKEYFLEKQSYADKYSSYVTATTLVSSLLHSNDFLCASIFSVRPEGRYIYSPNNQLLPPLVYLANYERLTRIEDFLPEGESFRFTDLVELNGTGRHYAIYAEEIRGHSGTVLHGSSPRYLMLLICDMDEVSAMLAQRVTDKQDTFLLCGSDGVVLAASRMELVGKSREELALSGEDIRVTTTSFSKCGWTLHTYMSTTYMDEIQGQFFRLAVVMVLLVVALMGGFFLLFKWSVVRPVFQVIDQLKAIPASIHAGRISCDMENEIGELVGSFNDMLDQIEASNKAVLEVQEKLYASELSQARVRLSALQNQINPHFLYNTLECLRSIGSVYNVPEVSNIAFSMGHIFRYCIKGSDIVTVASEMEIIREYLRIIDIRFLGRHTADLQIDEAMLEQPIIKMTLQPIVENAIYHGLEGKDGPGHLIIRGTIDEEHLHFYIADDGAGMEESRLKELQDSLHLREGDRFNMSRQAVGLHNIYLRGALYYGDNFRFHVESRLGEGTTVTIDIPRLPQGES